MRAAPAAMRRRLGQRCKMAVRLAYGNEPRTA
jgi:hypothetical protein